MIRIERFGSGPEILKRRGCRQTNKDRASYDAASGDYRSGVKKFLIKDHYRLPEVKDELFEIHYGKCCYCEEKFVKRDLHVEHFRPKGGFKQSRNQDYDCFPGYYWLAYCWNN